MKRTPEAIRRPRRFLSSSADYFAPRLHLLLTPASPRRPETTSTIPAGAGTPVVGQGGVPACRPRRIRAMTRVHPKAMPNWSQQVKHYETWTGSCVKEKIAADGKRHRCHKTEKHDDTVHACKCSLSGSSSKRTYICSATGHEIKPPSGWSRAGGSRGPHGPEPPVLVRASWSPQQPWRVSRAPSLGYRSRSPAGGPRGCRRWP
jgi:hypothetical protein